MLYQATSLPIEYFEMHTYVILPVHNRAHITARFVQCLAEQDSQEFTLLLVDDGCTDDTVELVRGSLKADFLAVLRGDGNLWWAGALQLAYEYLETHTPSSGDAVLIINDDVTITRNFLSCGLAALAEHPDACIQAIGVDRQTGTVDRGAVADLVNLSFRAAHVAEAPNCLSTRGLLMAAPTFMRSGGFRPRWLPHYLSDYEFTLRLQRMGAPLMVDERFSAEVSFELTGMEKPALHGVRRYWSDSFSNRAKFNPKHWSAFAVMVCPPSVIPGHLLRIWARFARALLAALRDNRVAP